MWYIGLHSVDSLFAWLVCFHFVLYTGPSPTSRILLFLVTYLLGHDLLYIVLCSPLSKLVAAVQVCNDIESSLDIAKQYCYAQVHGAIHQRNAFGF